MPCSRVTPQSLQPTEGNCVTVAGEMVNARHQIKGTKQCVGSRESLTIGSVSVSVFTEGIHMGISAVSGVSVENVQSFACAAGTKRKRKSLSLPFPLSTSPIIPSINPSIYSHSYFYFFFPGLGNFCSPALA